MVRRKSDEVRQMTDCKYHRAQEHERKNQRTHETRQADPEHEQWSACWCCCPDCEDLSWYHEEPPSLLTRSGELRPTWETSAGSPGSAETSASW